MFSSSFPDDHLFMGDANNSFSVVTRSLPARSTGSARTWTYLARQLPLRRPDHPKILTSSCDFSSKLGRQKCRPSCWTCHPDRSSLPEGSEDAVIVLRLATKLVMDFRVRPATPATML
jgi:hypothetical protein